MISVNQFSTPPPSLPVNKAPPPASSGGPASHQFQRLEFKPFKPPDGEFDGKRLRKSVMRKTVDYNCSMVNLLESRVWQRDARDRPVLQADICYASEVMPPPACSDNPINSVVTKFVRTSTNKAKCPIFCLAWTPEGRRMVTGASSGEFTLWNGLTFNFETILQAHDSSVRTMVWSHNDQWMITADTSGYVKYWQTNMNNVKLFQAHKDPIRGLSFSPSDQKFVTASDDGTVRIWDFFRCFEERVMRGHGSDVKCVDWHPTKGLIASGSKDNQQPIMLWDPRTGNPLLKLHAHKSTVMDVRFNPNGNWLCSGSRDHLLKLYDIRNLSTELQVFRGHKKEAACIAWHPQHEGLFASGGSDGSILFWHVGNDKEVGAIESAHDGIIWDMAWHPLGHILVSGSNDHTTKFWTRNRPGDRMRDRYNLNTLPAGVTDDGTEYDDSVDDIGDESAMIPGMGPEDQVEESTMPASTDTIPGLEFDPVILDRYKKIPYSKPIPRTFQEAWNADGTIEEVEEFEDPVTSWVVSESGSLFPFPLYKDQEQIYTDDCDVVPAGSVPLNSIKANAVVYAGFYIPLSNPVTGELIRDSFLNLTDEEAIACVTKDIDFAARITKERNQVIPFGRDFSGDRKLEKRIKGEWTEWAEPGLGPGPFPGPGGFGMPPNFRGYPRGPRGMIPRGGWRGRGGMEGGPWFPGPPGPEGEFFEGEMMEFEGDGFMGQFRGGPPSRWPRRGRGEGARWNGGRGRGGFEFGGNFPPEIYEAEEFPSGNGGFPDPRRGNFEGDFSRGRGRGFFMEGGEGRGGRGAWRGPRGGEMVGPGRGGLMWAAKEELNWGEENGGEWEGDDDGFQGGRGVRGSHLGRGARGADFPRRRAGGPLLKTPLLGTPMMRGGRGRGVMDDFDAEMEEF